ncbi:hypothetical protein [Kamptonema formosum]|nr:hypothetical protein [Oscillatoria sp. PCC 10802]
MPKPWLWGFTHNPQSHADLKLRRLSLLARAGTGPLSEIYSG